MIKAVVYDVDGTLINSEPLHVSAWDNALKQYGSSLGALPESFRVSMAGRKPIAIATNMVSGLQLSVTGDELLATKAGMLMQAVRGGVEQIPGAVSSVRRFYDTGLPLGIGAALDRGYVDLVLNQLEIADLFAAIVTGDQITKGKPDPETYATVVQRLGLKPSDCVVFEDAKSGIASAKNAGCYCIAIESDEAVKQDTSQADLVVKSWDSVTTATLKKLSS